MQLRGGTAATMASENPLLARREVAAEVDTGKLKVGNGTDRWNALPYVGGSGSGDHEQLEGLLGGAVAGHYHMTQDQNRRLGILINAMFPNGDDTVFIPCFNNGDTQNPILLHYDPATSEWIATDNSGTHNKLCCDKNLGTFDRTVSLTIRTGTFTDIYPGNYFTFTNVPYEYLDENNETQNSTYSGVMRIMHLDYPQCCGNTEFPAHSILVVPDNILFSAPMNDTNTTEGGYANSKMRTAYLRRAEAIFKACFGAEHVLSYTENLVSEVTNNIPSGTELCDCVVELMDRRMLWGNNNSSYSTYYQEPIFPHMQLAAFRHNYKLIYNYTRYWLRDVASSVNMWFYDVYSTGSTGQNSVTSINGVRPFALIN